MVYNRWLAWLMPPCCPGCGRFSSHAFCAGCRAEFRTVARPCPGCGLSAPGATCPRRATTWRIASVVAPFRYEEPLQGYLHALKFSGRRQLGRALGELLAEHLVARDAGLQIDLLVAVPLHRDRHLSRGFNQAVEIAGPVAAALGLPLYIAGIARRRATLAQSRLGARERRTSPIGAFEVSRSLGGARVAVIDDVMTTGATINAIAAELLRAGASDVHAWTVARSL